MKSGHYGIVLCKNAKHSAWLLFILTHELGHILRRHITRDGVLIDQGVDPVGYKASAQSLARAALDAGTRL